MKILLAAINAKYIHSNLAVYSLKAAAGEWKTCVETAEYTINQTKDEILEDLFLRKPDVLCFSCYIWNLEYVENTAREFHKIQPEVPIWAGGPEVSFETEAFLKEHPYIDGIMIGEGEETFRELCAYYAGSDGGIRRLERIDGLAFRKDGQIVCTREREIADLSTIPFCYDEADRFANKIIYYESSRGCPFRCSYCLSSIDKKLRLRDTELVRKELSFFLESGAAQVKFVDRTFNCDHRHAMEIWSFIKEHDNGITNFHFEIAADLLNEEELELLSGLRPGLIQLEIGVQSTNPETICAIRRTMNLERLEENVSRVRSFGNIHQHLDLIAGLPFEDFATFRHSFDEIYALWCEQLQLGFLKILKGSYMYQNAGEYGIIYRENPPYEVLCTKWLSFGEVIMLKRVEEMLEVYYNSGQFEVTMKVLYAIADSAFDLFLALGKFYERKELLQKQHSRISRCEILLEFLDSPEFDSLDKRQGGKRPEKQELQKIVKETLIFDLYARENCKTRPSWAPDQTVFREMTRKYCGKGKLSHLEPFHYDFPGREQKGLTVLPDRRQTPVWALFDYECRDAFSNQARVSFFLQ